MFLKEKIKSYLQGLQSYSNIRLILEITFVSNLLRFLAVFAFTIIYIFLGPERFIYSIGDSSGPIKDLFTDTGNIENTIAYFVILTILVPITETILGQFLPIKIGSLFTKNSFFLVSLSTIAFVLLHIGTAPSQVAMALFMGPILGIVYLLKNKVSSVWTTIGVVFAIHALTNLLAVITVWWFLFLQR
ncbi:MAG: CPBP family glutamic-type intramembrane protease [Patescibacteria group bacterium]